ncbi:Alpha/Beta hydrolase protein [Tricladium varicosporioides]|nr:Alpha/Beta hydrolase protein [Hymenoscyphus varicosporioides]
MLYSFLSVIIWLPYFVFSQFPPEPQGVILLKSRFGKNVTISYKETFICETTPGVHSYSGYVHLPPDVSMFRAYPINMFFWYFESRIGSANAPLSIWLNGGPGASSTADALGENGPCIVLEDSNSTELNPWSWNNKVNMLYIDQPVQVGFSYDTLANGTYNALSSTLLPVISDFGSGIPEQNETFFVGTFPSLDSNNVANSTGNASPALWSFLQAWLSDFPRNKIRNNKLSIWAESYGGHWGPGLAGYIQSQNDKIMKGTLKNASVIEIDTVGVQNGGIDFLVTAGSYPEMAYNNTYNFQAIPDADYLSAKQNLTACVALIKQCQTLATTYDSDNYGNNVTVNAACSNAYEYCYLYVEATYLKSGRSPFDIGHTSPDPTPYKYEIGFLNQHWVQEALGVPLNFTYQNMAVYNQVMATGDIVRGGFLETLGSLVDRGIQVVLFYGDRDYVGNWLSGEQSSLSIPSSLSQAFGSAGYAYLTTNSTRNGGVVRQHRHLSFARVFDAAHGVPYYQPETSLRIFERAMFHRDIATGQTSISTRGNYSSKGSQSSFGIRNIMPEDPNKVCYTYMALLTCTVAQIGMLAMGNAVVKDWVVVGYQAGNGTVVYY